MTDLSEAGRIPEQLEAKLIVSDEVRRELTPAKTALTAAQDLVIDSSAMASVAAGDMNAVIKQGDRVKILFDGFVKPAKDIIALAEAIFKPRLADLTAAKAEYKRKLLAWDEQEKARIADENRKREEEAAKARRDAEARAAAERAKAEEIARQKREQAEREAQARAEAERKEREAAEAVRRAKEAGDKEAQRIAQEEQRKAQAEAQARAAAEAKANEQAQAAVAAGEEKAISQEIAAASVASVTPITQERVAGTTLRSNWIAKLAPNTDEAGALKLLVAAAAQRPELLGLLKLDLPAINKMAKALKQNMSVPGFVAFDDKLIAGSRK